MKPHASFMTCKKQNHVINLSPNTKVPHRIFYLPTPVSRTQHRHLAGDLLGVVISVGLVKALGSMLKGTVANVIKKIFKLDIPHPFRWVTGEFLLVYTVHL